MTTSSYGSGPITHTTTIYTWRELALEQLAPLLATITTKIPTIRPRRITYIRRGAITA